VNSGDAFDSLRQFCVLKLSQYVSNTLDVRGVGATAGVHQVVRLQVVLDGQRMSQRQCCGCSQ